MDDRSSQKWEKCPKCKKIILSKSPDNRFCISCGYELPMSIILRKAFNEVEYEDEHQIFYECRKRKCDKDDHLNLVLWEKIYERLTGDEEREFINFPQTKFCPFCGKKLPRELPSEWQEKLEKQLSEMEDDSDEF